MAYWMSITNLEAAELTALISAISYPHLSKESDKRNLRRHLQIKSRENLKIERAAVPLDQAAKIIAEKYYGRRAN